MHKIITEDGSVTYYSEQFNEHYHSTHGAVDESNLVYIEALNKIYTKTGKTEITVFEMGFGSGLNALLAFEFAQKHNISLSYFCVEKFPIDAETLLSESQSALYNQIINSEWNKINELQPGLFLLKIEMDMLHLNFENYRKPDVIFHDAFSPDKQPELWSAELFSKIYVALNTPGILATYSSKGIVKEALREAGFVVKRLPGPKGKRHILNALKNFNELKTKSKE